MYKKRKEIRQQTNKHTKVANHKSRGLSEFKYEKSESGGFLLSFGITLAHAGGGMLLEEPADKCNYYEDYLLFLLCGLELDQLRTFHSNLE